MNVNLPDAAGDKSTRRKFLRRTSASAIVFAIVPSFVVGTSGQTPPSGKLNLAAIGVGGMGQNNLKQCTDENIVALCDVDEDYAGKVFKQYPGAKVYRDYRQMLERQKDIDAIIVATPDHTHAVIALAAIRAGKHVYVQKPLAHSVYDVRLLTEAPGNTK